MENTLAYVDHNYHVKTKSGDFLREIFKSKFEIKNYWIGKEIIFKKELFNYKNIFFFQILPSTNQLKKFKNKNIMWAPMYDSPHFPYGFSDHFWRIIKYYDIKVLCFSNRLKKQLIKHKIKHLSLKYFKKPKIFNNVIKKLNIFFWDRGDLEIDDWINQFKFDDINKIYYLTFQRNKKFYFDRKIKKKIVLLKKNFLPKKKFLNLIKKSDIFICPRKKEGIGMAQVEAISMGKYLIGTKDSTMEDYIANQKIGQFISKRPKFQIDGNYLQKTKKFRQKYAENGYKKFEKNKFKIIRFFSYKNYLNYSILKETHFDIFFYYKKLLRTIILFLKR